VEIWIGPKRFKAATTSSTSTSGAEAPGGQSDRALALQPLRTHLAAVGHQVAWNAGLRPISRSRFELELLRAPTTMITSTNLASSRTAV